MKKMNDQERLEYIKKLHDEANEIGKNGKSDAYEKIEEILSKLFYQSHTDFLISQTEQKIILEQKVKDLEEQFSFSEKFVGKKYQRLLEENQRYKQALEFYVDEDIYTVQDGERIKGIFTDQGEKARQALSGDTDG